LFFIEGGDIDPTLDGVGNDPLQVMWLGMEMRHISAQMDLGETNCHVPKAARFSTLPHLNQGYLHLIQSRARSPDPEGFGRQTYRSEQIPQGSLTQDEHDQVIAENVRPGDPFAVLGS